VRSSPEEFFSPREKEERAHSSGVANDRPANPVACFFDAAVDDSPSPGLSRHSRQATAEGEGRGEVGPRRILSHPTRGFDLLAACFIHCA
jgi:hypothetical protein